MPSDFDPKAKGTPAKTIVVTGAAHGIGRATCTALARAGYRVGLLDRDRDGLETLARELEELGAFVAASAVDVRESGPIHEAVSTFERLLGPIEVLITCAGVGSLSTAENLEIERLQAMFDINVVGMARTIQAVLPGMFDRKRGHIIGIASVAGYRGLPWMPGYCATKAAVANYLEALRPSFKRRGVAITTLHPGFVATGMTLETPFRKPVKFLTAEQAAEFVVLAVKKRPRDMVFPFSARFGMGVLRRFPSILFDRIMDRAGPLALTTDF